MFTPINVSEFIGKELLYLPQCQSTNNYVIDLGKKGTLKDGFLCITDNQTKGRGQRGNFWLAQPNQNLTFTFVINTEHTNLEAIFKINILISVGILTYFKKIENNNTDEFKIKWPNDFYYKKQKIGGILIEIITDINQQKVIIVGIGLNINQTNFNYLNANSLRNIFQKEFDLQQELQKIIVLIESFLKFDSLPIETIIENLYAKNLLQFNQLARYKIDNEVVEGTITAIKNDGRLGIKIENKVIYYEKKEIVFL